MLFIDNYATFYVIFMYNSLYYSELLCLLMDAKRITNFSTKTSQPLMQNSQQAAADLQNGHLFDHGPLS